MTNIHELSTHLAKIEVDLFEDKKDLCQINSNLQTSYEYEEDLLKKLSDARKNTAQLKQHFFEKCSAISDKYSQMKNAVTTYTQTPLELASSLGFPPIGHI